MPRLTSRPSWRAFAIALGVVLLPVAWAVPSHLHALSFVARAAELQEGWGGALARLGSGDFREQALSIPSRHGALRARLYRPERGSERTVLLTTGVHADGIDEPRLVELARDLAAGGVSVVTPELPDLLEYRITPRLADLVEDAARWVVDQPELAPDRKVGLIGISFSGGLSLVAAGRPGLQEKVAFVLSFGGHGDLPRVLRYLCSGVQSDGVRRPPHDYGLAVLLLNMADRVVPTEQVEPLRDAIRTFLRASNLTLHDVPRAEETFARARAMQAELPAPASTLMAYVNERDVASLGAVLLPHIEAFASDASLSPERSPPPRAPVWLLHGAGDNVVPAIESTLLARHLADHTEVQQLSTPLISARRARSRRDRAGRASARALLGGPAQHPVDHLERSAAASVRGTPRTLSVGET